MRVVLCGVAGYSQTEALWRGASERLDCRARSCSEEQQTQGAARAGARGRFEAGDVDSCCAPAGMGRRSEEELRGGKPLDNPHDSAAEGAGPQRGSGGRSRRNGARWWLLGLLEQAVTQWKKFRSSPVGKKAEVADTHKSARQHVEEKAAQELIDRHGHNPLAVAVRGIPPSEGDDTIREGKQSVVGDGDAVGVGTEIAQYVFWTTERRLRIDDPVLSKQYPEPG